MSLGCKAFLTETLVFRPKGLKQPLVQALQTMWDWAGEFIFCFLYVYHLKKVFFLLKYFKLWNIMENLVVCFSFYG